MRNRFELFRLSPLISFSLALGLAFSTSVQPLLHAAVVGISQPAPSLTQERIDKLPVHDRAAWSAYLKRSQQQAMRDRATLTQERKGLAVIPPLPREQFNAHSVPLDRDAAWYATAEARHIGDVVVSFQTPAGGWSKNLDMATSARLRGQSYATNNVSRLLGPNDFDAPRYPNWNYVGTLDNDATNTQIHFLALLSTANSGAAGATYRASYLRGIHYLLAAQFPNGGWPQVWPLEGGYHDAITFNDNALTEAAAVLTDASSGRGEYAFVPADLRRQAAAAAARALDCILAAQIVVQGKRTLWAQQLDALTLAPVSGRNFEPAAIATGESADVLIYLMSLPKPSAAVISAVRDGVAYLKSIAIYGQEWQGGRGVEGGRHLVATAGAGPIWPRYLSLTTGKPIFGDRDKTIHDEVSELSLERRNGYAWYSAGPQRAIDVYADWPKRQITNGNA